MLDAGTGMAKWMCVVCAFALLCIGFAHQPPAFAAQQPSQAELAQYAFPDGSLPVLCLPGEDGDPGGKAAYGNGCAACRLTADFDVPVPADLAGSVLAYPADSMAPLRIEIFARYVLTPDSSPRAPPSGSIA